MKTDAMTEEYEHVELFGKPALFTNGRLDRSAVPDGWYCYDLRGGDDDPGRPATLENRVVVNHAGTILTPEAIPFPTGSDFLAIEEELNFLGEEYTIPEFCEEHGLVCPVELNKYPIRPASPDEAGLSHVPSSGGMEIGGLS